MIPKNRELFLEVVGHEEFVDIQHDYDVDGTITNSYRVPGTERAFLLLKAPNGATIRAQIPYEDLAMIVHDFIGKQPV